MPPSQSEHFVDYLVHSCTKVNLPVQRHLAAKRRRRRTTRTECASETSRAATTAHMHSTRRTLTETHIAYLQHIRHCIFLLIAFIYFVKNYNNMYTLKKKPMQIYLTFYLGPKYS